MRKTLLTAVAALAALGSVAQAQDDRPRVEVGVLTCRMTDRTNMIVVSETRFGCVFDPVGDRPAEEFTGVIEKLGADLTLKDGETLVWAVFAPSIDSKIAALEGTYVGVGADVTLGKGIGANAMLGGLDKSIALQPLSVTATDGAGLSLAVQSLRLDYVGRGQ